MSNPLLSMQGLPPFSQIKAEHVVPAIDTVLQENREAINRLLENTDEPNWQNFVEPFEGLQDRLNRVWSPVGHLNSVLNSEALRQAYNTCLPRLSDYQTELGQHAGLYQAFKRIADSDAFNGYSQPQRQTINNALRDFRLAGIELDADSQQRYKKIKQRLSELKSKFSENVLDATQAWFLDITDESQLSGIPESARELARQTANEAGIEGWRFTLEFPSYFAVITYADDAGLREQIYYAYSTRASDQGPNAGKWDNAPLMQEIVALRHEAAQLLGFNNYAENSLATKMASNTQEVIAFLHDLAERGLPYAKKDLEEIRDFARNEHQVGELNAWDIPYYSEKLRQHRYNISQEALKPYFPEDSVVQGMFDVVQRLYGIHIEEHHDVDTWHKDVRFFTITDDSGELRGQFYLDLYARNNKRGGAWMDECIVRRRTATGLQTPVAYLTCNFSPPVGDKPALFTHNEVETLFHEFGHGLHHMLTQVDHPGVSGINGVPWDAVELPSQFMENWCWQKESLSLFARHYETGEPLPDDMFERMLAAKNFQSGMQLVRQLEFALFDFRLHLEYDPAQPLDVEALLNDVRQQVAVVFPPEYNRFANNFTHIFAGGYAAGYYSYKWAEVLSSDAFSKFEENGIFDEATGKDFMNAILEQGGSKDAMELFIAFRGRPPKVDALLRHSGIAA